MLVPYGKWGEAGRAMPCDECGTKTRGVLSLKDPGTYFVGRYLNWASQTGTWSNWKDGWQNGRAVAFSMCRECADAYLTLEALG